MQMQIQTPLPLTADQSLLQSSGVLLLPLLHTAKHGQTKACPLRQILPALSHPTWKNRVPKLVWSLQKAYRIAADRTLEHNMASVSSRVSLRPSLKAQHKLSHLPWVIRWGISTAAQTCLPARLWFLFFMAPGFFWAYMCIQTYFHEITPRSARKPEFCYHCR